MPRFNIEIDLPPGIVSDSTSFTNARVWVDGSNIRFVEGRPQAAGYDHAPPIRDFRNIYAICKSPSDSSKIVFSEQSSLRLVNPGEFSTTDISPTSWPASPYVTFADWGTTLILNTRGGKIYSQSGTSAAAVISGAPTHVTTILVTPERQVLALGCNEVVSGTFNGLCIRGCDLEDYTAWTPTAANNSFENILEGSGSIVAARMVGTYVAVLTDQALYMGQFIGDPGETYRFDKIADKCGCIALNALTVAGGVLYWLGSDFCLRRWQPGATPQIVPCPIFTAFSAAAAVGDTAMIFLTYLFRWGEVRISYASAYATYSIRESERAQIPVWSQGTSLWTAALDDPAFISTIAGQSNASQPGIAYVDMGGDRASAWFITTGDFYLDDGNTRVEVQRLVPDWTGTGEVRTFLYLRNLPQSTSVVTKGPYALTYGGAKKIDFRASGMITAVRFEAGDAVPWRMGKPVFNCVTMGGR